MTSLEFFSQNWCDLSWTPWISFSAQSSEFQIIPKEPGLYRIRAENEQFLMYIGQTGRSLRERLNDLRRNTAKEIMPFNDPHTAAPSLWAWKDANEYSYECSAAAYHSDSNQRIGWECYLLWQYRILNGSSTLCNFGRFHPHYRKSTNRKQGIIGAKLPIGEINPAGGASHPPLLPIGKPSDRNWMNLSWSEKLSFDGLSEMNIPHEQGLYLLFDSTLNELVYIGESVDIHNRLRDHQRKSWDRRKISVSFNIQPQSILPHNLKEFENDLIGGYFGDFHRLPVYQYRNMTK